jgi:hypothetical protein
MSELRSCVDRGAGSRGERLYVPLPLIIFFVMSDLDVGGA